MLRKIALEEHALVPEIESYWGKTVADIESRVREHLLHRLRDFGDMRLETM